MSDRFGIPTITSAGSHRAKLIAHHIGYGNGSRRSAVRNATANARHLPCCHVAASVRKRKPIRNAFCAHMVDRHCNVEYLFAPCRREKLARRSYARKRNHLAALLTEHTEAQMPQKRVLRPFHKTKEGREMHDPGHIGVGKFDKPRNMKWRGHSEGHESRVESRKPIPSGPRP